VLYLGLSLDCGLYVEGSQYCAPLSCKSCKLPLSKGKKAVLFFGKRGEEEDLAIGIIQFKK